MIDEARYQLTTGLDLDRYLGNWLLITAVLFAVSGLHYALKLRGGRAERPMIVRASSRAEARAEPASPPGRAVTAISRGRARDRRPAGALGRGPGDLRPLRLVPALIR